MTVGGVVVGDGDSELVVGMGGLKVGVGFGVLRRCR